MPADQRPLYIEMIGPSGVGKSTLLRLVAEGLEGRPVYLRGGFKNRKWQNLGNAGLSWKRWRRLVQFYSYLRRQKNVSGGLALWRAAAIAGIPACRSFIRAGNGALLVEEGPVLYLSSCGGFGEVWKDWLHLLLPDDPRAQTFFVMLTASPEELERRRRSRARPEKIRLGPKGTEGMTPELLAQAGRFWLQHLAATGANCIEIDTETRSIQDVAQTILAFVRASTRADRAQPEPEGFRLSA